MPQPPKKLGFVFVSVVVYFKHAVLEQASYNSPAYLPINLEGVRVGAY